MSTQDFDCNFEVDRLHECGTRLISDVVTCELDVRAAAERLREEVEA